MFLISMAVILISTFSAIVIIYREYSGQNLESIQNELAATAKGAEFNGIDYLKSLSFEHRVTLIGVDGTVLYDNRENEKLMENHNEREEVVEARKTGKGYSERYSDTISKKAVNVATLLSNGQVLRISEDTATVWSVILDALLPMFLVMIGTCVIVTYLSYRVSKIITKPINEINLNTPDKTETYDEVRPLIDKIMDQNRQIEKNLQQIKEEHNRQDSMRRDFTANVSHELKTPLTSISGFAEIIQNGMVDKEEDIRKFAGKIYDESKRLMNLVGDIIKLSQLEENNVHVTMEPIDLYETADAVLAHLEHTARKKNVSLHLKGNHAVITGADQIVEEMIFNLVDNAVKYNVENGQVIVEVGKNSQGVFLSVSDTGIGIPKEDIDRIFERFFRVDKSHSREIGGTGLGLSIVKHGAVFHNASVSVKSATGKGSTFTIVF